MFLASQNDAVECDRCGLRIESSSVTQSLVVNDIDEATGQVVTMHFCRENRCNQRVLTKKNVEYRASVLAEREGAEADA